MKRDPQGGQPASDQPVHELVDGMPMLLSKEDRAVADEMKELQDAAKAEMEKRRFERMKTGLQIKYRGVGPTEEATLIKEGGYAAPESFHSHTTEIKDFTKVASEDISLGGVRISTPAPLPEGTKLWLQVSIPQVPIPVNAIAVVRWSRTAGSLCSAGLQFSSISKTDLEKVERYLVLQKKADMQKKMGA